MEDRELLENELNLNEFVYYAINVYNIAFNMAECDTKDIIEVKKPKHFWDKPIVYAHNPTVKQLNKNIKSFLEENIISPDGTIKAVEFKYLWRYCQFLRWAEKTVFYKNDQNSTIICDSGMHDGTLDTAPRKLYIKTEDISISIEMTKIRNGNRSTLGLENLLGNTISDDFRENFFYTSTLTIVVERNYGKKMKNTFTVINGECTMRDNSDIYLINTINSIVSDKIYHSYLQILESIRTKSFLNQFYKDNADEYNLDSIVFNPFYNAYDVYE